MRRLNFGAVALVIGVLLLALSLSLDVIRPSGAPGFGSTQLLIALVGIALLAVGMGWLIWGTAWLD